MPPRIRKRMTRRARIRRTLLRGTLLALGPPGNLHCRLKGRVVHETRARHLIRRRERRAARKGPRVNLDRKAGRKIERRSRWSVDPVTGQRMWTMRMRYR